MTNTKWLSALLAGTALTVASTAAMADTSLLTMSRNAAGEGVTFSIAPTADMPGAATEVTVGAEVRTVIKSVDDDISESSTNGNSTDVSTRGRIFVKGSTQTAVGEVGANLRIGSTGIDKYTGYWMATPDLKVFGGKTDSIASITHGADWNSTGGVWSGVAHGLTNKFISQAGVSFTSGPLVATVGLEAKRAQNATNTSAFSGAVSTSDIAPADANMAVSGSLSYSAGPLSAQVVASMGKGKDSATSTYLTTDNNGNLSVNSVTPTVDETSKSMIGAGVTFTADMFTVSAAYAHGKGTQRDWTYIGNLGGLTSENTWDAGSVLATLKVNEAVRIEAFAGMAKLGLDSYNTGYDFAEESVGYGGGVFYAPVSQLTLGAGASTNKVSYEGTDDSDTQSTVGVGAWFSF